MAFDKDDWEDILDDIKETVEDRREEKREERQRREEAARSSNQTVIYGSQDSYLIRFFVLLIVAIIVVGALGFFIHRQSQQAKEMQEQLERQQMIISSLEGNRDENTKSNETVPIVTSDTIKSALNGISELVTQEYTYRNADKKESSDTWVFGWERPFSGKSIIITYDGVIKAGINFSDIKIDVDDDKHTVTITLPKSEITDNNIPQETIEIVEVKDGLFNELTHEDYNDFVAEQKIVMQNKAIEQGLLTKADEEARKLVTAIVSVLPGMEEYKLTVN